MPHRIARIVLILVVVGIAVPMQGQEPPPPDQKALAFEVASIKPNTSAERPANNWELAPGRADFHNSQVVQLIKRAWGDFSLPVEGGQVG
jgi:hypothetical protein